MKYNISRSCTFLAVVTTISSCISVKPTIDKALLKVPESYVALADSTNNIASIKADLFFEDARLVSLINTALANNIDLQAASQNIEIAKANLRFAKGLLLPTVSASANAGIQKFGEYTADGAGNKGTEIYNGKDIPKYLPDYSVGFVSSWELDVWGKLKNKKQAAFSRYLGSIQGKNWIQTNLIAEIATNYYELIALDNETAIIKDNIALQENALGIIKKQKEAGRSTELAVKQFEAQILNAKASAKELEQSTALVESNLNLLLSRYPQPIERSRLNDKSSFLSKVNSGIPSQLLQNRPDIRQAELELMAAKLDVKAARKSFYPTVNLNAGIAVQAFDVNLLVKPQSLTYGLFGGLLAPIFNRSAIQAEYLSANAIQKQTLLNYQKSILNAFYEVYTEQKQIENLRNISSIKKEEIAALEKAIHASTLLFQASRADYLEVLFAQQRLLETRLSVNQLTKNQLLSTINMYKVVGGGWR
jgi:outer membrane protein, multidrug efflux system